MRIAKLLCVASLIVSCGGGSGGPPDSGIRDAPIVDAPGIMPMITSFVATPSQITSGVPAMITWNWTYAIDPTFPDPVCTIDNGVGPVTRMQMTSVTLTAVTTFTLSCTNFAGTAMRQVVIGVPPVAPVLATFTATPSPITPNTATNVTWSWTYSNAPTPLPSCTIDFGVGTVTNGMATSVTLPAARTFRLRCFNSAGSATRDAMVSVNECASALTYQCNANASCTDTADSYTCACNNGYSGNGDTCSIVTACTTGTVCDANAQCIGGASCVCNAGYVGTGLACQPLPIVFTTSVAGTGQLNATGWPTPTVTGNPAAGLAYADAICQTLANNAGLSTRTFVAWMSNAVDDAYCRVHGLSGKKGNMCGLGSTPATAGPWIRRGDSQPFTSKIDRLLAPIRETLYPANRNESGVDIAGLTDRVWTGTDDAGVYATNTCTDWTTSAGIGVAGEVHGGGTSWTRSSNSDPSCANAFRMRCMEVTSSANPPLPPRHPANVRRAFLTSVSGTGVLSTWADAQGQTSITAADNICQTRARFAGYANPLNFKAWMAYGSNSATGRINTVTATWARPDGVILGNSKSDAFADGRIGSATTGGAPLYLTETGVYVAGNSDTLGAAWTGTTSFGGFGSYCSSWTSSFSSATYGRHDTLDGRWAAYTTQSCSLEARMYCVED